jgi:metal-responsive CopG/Arc/MetJ family transcriptional regulator
MEMTKRPNKRLLAISIPPAMIEACDKIAARQFKSRSEIIREALLAKLEAEGCCPVAA